MGSQQKSHMMISVWSGAGTSFQKCPCVGASKPELCYELFLLSRLRCGLSLTGSCNPGLGSFHLVKDKSPGDLSSELSINDTRNSFENGTLIQKRESGPHIPLFTTPFYLVLLRPCIHIGNYN